MSYYNERMCNVLTRRTGDWLLYQSWPRTTAVVALSFAALSAYACWTALSSIGVESIGVRFAVGGTVGYVTYLLLLGLWFLSVSPIEAKSLAIEGVEQINTEEPGESKFDEWLDESADAAIRECGREARGVLGLVVGVGILGFLFVSCHFVYHAPWYLGKLLVDGGRVRHRATREGNRIDFLVLPFLHSWPIAVLLLMHCIAVGIVFQAVQGR